MKSFEGSFRNLSFSLSTSILLNFFFPFIDIRCPFSSLKLQYCRTIALLKLMLFSKATTFMRFPAKKNTGCPKEPRDFPPRTPRRVSLGLPSPSPRVCTDGRTYERTLTSQPNISDRQVTRFVYPWCSTSSANNANFKKSIRHVLQLLMIVKCWHCFQ